MDLKSAPDALFELRCNINGDSRLSIRDVTLIQMFLAGIDNPFDIGTEKNCAVIKT